MGTQDVDKQSGEARIQEFKKLLLNDLRALEHMLREGLFESGVRRIGAEQELFLIDASWRAAPLSEEVLETLNDPYFTTELARFNMEYNLDPCEFGGACLRKMEEDVDTLLVKAREAAAQHGARVVLTGILPTLHKSDLDLENMTNRPRYAALNDALTRLRGGAYEFRISGVDDLSFQHYSVMLEACNTSFQVHFQVGPEEFAKLYNVAQTVTAPVLAASTNSPLLFGKRLWHETRIALFEQSVDTRTASAHLREIHPRVSFGSRWVDKSVLEIFQEDIARFKVLLATDIDEDPFKSLEENQPPKLKALLLHNSTVYRWNRPCYGVSYGKPHLRIEARFLPAGPTPLDEVANAAFWFGLMSGLSAEHSDISRVMDFDHAKGNFFAASRDGLDAKFHWLEGRRVGARDLILEELIPLARQGLTHHAIDEADVDRYLGTVEDRVRSGRTGARWLLDSFDGLKEQGTKGERLAALTAASVHRLEDGHPVHEWDLARIEEAGGWKVNFLRVEQYMDTDLFTVNEDEIVDLVANIMDWRRIRHVPVEDSDHRLVGLVSYRSLLRHLGRGDVKPGDRPVSVREIMGRDPVTVAPETPTLEAIAVMRTRGIACLPVVKDERLVGLVTEAHFLEVSRQLLESFLSDA